ncbi:MAG: endonuclease VIII [Xanthomonadales bacterium]|nr:endonuclease VIII [Gammaproteobacteria bacterium]NND56233.1 endonuclease VIII [Xanthomonadales bacterium]NNK52308.1 endonuclease VIII [Xanthomonadales bacterium]
MPEGPEIRRAADRIAKVLVNQPIAAAEFIVPSLQPFEKRINGSVVNRIDTRGKAMLTRFDNGLTLYSHNQLYGRWFVTKRGRLPRTNRSLRVALHTAAHSALLYSATEVDVLTESQLQHHPFLRRIGPDILDTELTADLISARLDEARFRRRSVGGLYLDQSFLAGLGNYLRTEILYRARVNPRSRPVDLDKAAHRRLARETLAISKRSYRTGGVTLSRERARILKSSGASFENYRFWAFGRRGLPCYVCGDRITRLNIAGRRLYLCPGCQPPA